MTASHPADRGTPAAWSRRRWMLYANTPVACWFLLLTGSAAAAATGRVGTWIPVHVLGIGVITTSIMVWSQYFTARFTGTRPTRAHQVRQLYRIGAVSVGTVLLLAGQLPATTSPRLSLFGAASVAAGALLHGISLAAQYLAAERTRRFRPVVAVYVLATTCLLGGVTAGALLTVGVPGAWVPRLHTAHLLLNLPGFVGLAAFGSLTLMFPAVWRTRGGVDRTIPALASLACGLATSVTGALLGFAPALGAGLVLYAVGWAIAALPWLGNVRDVLAEPRDRVTFAAVAVLAAPAWLIVGVLTAAADALRGGHVAVSPPVAPLLVGFGAQLLIGVLSFLVPSVIGGGPAAVRLGMGLLDTLGLLRSTLLNGSLALLLLPLPGDPGPVPAVFVVLSLGAFLPLAVTAVPVQRHRPRESHEPGTPPTATGGNRPAYGQVVVGLTVLGALTGLILAGAFSP
ncbi:hypothetical protein OS125_11060 [Corynebacterium sp. P7003]|uniref:Copper oxidase n=1 Tax=Corynebacterium pygosceleis TaxID=2800406 RepID=A0ABT3WU64_9CORY|nr:hypothetical protein [Corynebacterium pygosceleis]MCX7445770.1 hypothetical protein [Corynebacterium pygosceleis]